MNCETVQKLLPFLADGDIDVDVGEQLREHLIACNSCREDYRELQRFLDVVGGALHPDRSVPDHRYLAEVRRRINRRKATAVTVGRFGSVAAVFFAAVGIIWWSLMNSSGVDRRMLSYTHADYEYSEEYVTTVMNYLVDSFDTTLMASYADIENEYRSTAGGEAPVIEDEYVDAMITHAYNDVSVDAILTTMDDEEAALLVASLGR